MIIKLTPENLGNLTIQLTQSGDGALQVVLHASSAKAAGVLSVKESSAPLPFFSSRQLV